MDNQICLCSRISYFPVASVEREREREESCSDEKARRNSRVYLSSRGRWSRRKEEWRTRAEQKQSQRNERSKREREQKRNEFRTQMWKPEPGCSKMNLSWTMPARSFPGNFRGKLCEMCVHSLPNVARRGLSVYVLHPLLFHLSHFFFSFFFLLLLFFTTVKEKESRGVETRWFYLILECAPQTRRIFSYTRLDPVLRYFNPARDVRRTCFEWREGRGGELERIDERIFVYGVGTLHLHVAPRGICLRGRNALLRWKVNGCRRKLRHCRVNLSTWNSSIWSFL